MFYIHYFCIYIISLSDQNQQIEKFLMVRVTVIVMVVVMVILILMVIGY